MVQQAFRVDQVSTSNIEFKSNSFISSIAADATLASNVHLVLPTSVGSSGQVLATDGSGNLSFVTQGVGGPADLVQDNVNSLTSTVDSFGVYANNTFGADGSNVSVANVTSQEFSIDGSTNTFTLVNTTDNVNKLLVSYGGIAQKPSEYTVSNTDLTLSNTRPLVAGTTVEVRYLDFEFSGSVTNSGNAGIVAGGATTVIAPFAFARVASTTNASGTNISWSNWNPSNGTLDFTFSSAQSNTDYIVVSDAETFDDYYVGITNKTVNGFRASFYDDSVNRTPSSSAPFALIIYGATPTVDVNSLSGTSYSTTLYSNISSGVNTFNSASTPSLATYTAGKIGVYRNGVKLPATDYTATDGTSLVLNNATIEGDDIEVVNFGTVSVSLDDVTDVDLTTNAPANGQALIYVSANSKWEPGSVASSSNLTVANASASSTGSISYDSGSEVLTYTPPDLSVYQSTLVSNTNIKTINGTSVLGSGNITISSGGGVAGTLGSLTKSFANNESATITLSSNVSPVPNVSVFKEVPQGGSTSKGNWDVNANATNYDFYDEKPISYASSTLTPSATGDGTFTSSNPIVTSYDFSNPTAGATSTYTAPDWHVFAFNTTGTKFISWSSNKLKSYNLSSAWDITTINSSAGAESTISTADIYGTTISADGTKLIGYHSGVGYIYEYTMSTPFDVTTLTADGNTGSLGGASTSGAFNWFIKPGTYDTAYALINRHLYKYTFTGGSITTGTVTRDANFLDLDPANQKNYINSGQLQFKPDGTEFYIGQGTDSIIERWVLSTAWDITTATKSSDTVPFTTAGNIWLKPDGTKIYYVDDGNSKRIDEYNIGSSLAFNAADVGKKVVGNSGSAIITSTSGTYTSVTPFADTSAISSWQLFGAEGKADASGIKISGFASGYDIANAVYDSVSFSLQAQDSASAPQNTYTGPKSLRFNSEGTKMYFVAGNSLDHIFEYDLSTAWDLSSASYNNSNLVVTSQTSSPAGIDFSSDGTKLFLIDEDQDKIWKYNLSTAWALSSASYSNNQTPGDILRNLDAKPGGLVINSDGTRILWLGKSNERVYQMTLSTAYDLSTASMDTKLNGLDAAYLDVSSQGTSFEDINISSDGKKLFLVNGYGNVGVYQYDLANPYEINDGTTNSNQGTTSYNNIHFSMTQDGRPSSVAFDALGTKMYGVGVDNDTVYQYSTGSNSTPYSQYMPALTNSSTGQINSSSWVDLDSMTADETKNDGDVFYAVSTDDRTSWGVIKDGDGVRKIARNNSGTWQYNNGAIVPPAGYLIPASFRTGHSSSLTVTTSDIGLNASVEMIIRTPVISDNGTKLTWMNRQDTEPYIVQYDLSTAYDISSGTFSYKHDMGYSGAFNFETWCFNTTGTKIYITGSIGTTVTWIEHTLSTAWDLSTASYTRTETYTPTIAYREDFIVAATNDNLYTITESNDEGKVWSVTNGDISTATVTTTVHPMTNNYMYQPTLSMDGTKLAYTELNDRGDVYIETLATPFDFSSSTGVTQVLSTNNTDIYKTIAYSDDGLYAVKGDAVNVTGDKVLYAYSTGTAASGSWVETESDWTNGTYNNEHATLQQALGAQSFNRMNKAQLQAVTDPNHYVLGDTLDLMIAPYAASGTSPISDGVTIGYQASALIKQAIPGTDYEAYFPSSNSVSITSLAAQNLKVRII